MLGKIEEENLNNIQTIYYHGSCPDGIIARQILKIVFPDKKYIPYYFEEFSVIPKYSLFIDCSPKAHQIEEMIYNGCLIADHHISMFPALEPFLHSNQVLFGESEKIESGAKLAFHLISLILKEKQHRYTKVQQVAEMIAISDTWQKDNKLFTNARKLASYITFFGNAFNVPLKNLLSHEHWNVIEDYAKVQDRKTRNQVARAIIVDDIAFINDMNISNAAEILRSEKNMRIIVGYNVSVDLQTNQSTIYYSLRSSEEFDCAEFCKSQNGGGHKAAAGFSTEYIIGKDPIGYFLSLK